MSPSITLTREWAPGVLSKDQMRQLHEQQYIKGIDGFEKAFDWSALDLSLSDEGYLMEKGSIKPCGPRNQYANFLRPPYAKKLDPQTDGTFQLKSNSCYVFKLRESFSSQIYGKHLFAQATPKSSVGRMDAIVRLIVDGQSQYDHFDGAIENTSSDNVYLEIIPISFNVRVKPGISLTQLRFFYGKEDNCIIKDEEFIKGLFYEADDQQGLGCLSVNLINTDIGNQKAAAFCAKKNVGDDYMDLWVEDDKARPLPIDYWSLVASDEHKRIIIERNKFYIIRSKERICLPRSVAVYARAMDESLGEMRIHYAGFVHPCFGQGRIDINGTPLIFEVRGHNVDVNLAHKERLAKLVFYRMSMDAKDEDGEKSYHNQELQLSKFFSPWPLQMTADAQGNVTLGEDP
jgi:dCTP deaminase